MDIRIDTSDFKNYKRQLDNLQKNAFPKVVKGVLNDCAFHMKQKEIYKEFDENFTVRRKTFIKAFTAAEKCSGGLDINKMESKAGVYKGVRNQDVGEQLVRQELGGNVNRRAIPTKKSRYSNSDKKTIQNKLKYRYFRQASKKRKGSIVGYDKNEGAIFVTRFGSVIILGKGTRYEDFENGNRRFLPGNTVKVLYTKRRNAKIKKHPFIKPASYSTQKHIPDFFKKQFEFRIKRITK